jgi:hypothetical protein
MTDPLDPVKSAYGRGNGCFGQTNSNATKRTRRLQHLPRGDQRKHLLAVPLNEGRANALDPRELG